MAEETQAWRPDILLYHFHQVQGQRVRKRWVRLRRGFRNWVRPGERGPLKPDSVNKGGCVCVKRLGRAHHSQASCQASLTALQLLPQDRQQRSATGTDTHTDEETGKGQVGRFGTQAGEREEIRTTHSKRRTRQQGGRCQHLQLSLCSVLSEELCSGPHPASGQLRSQAAAASIQQPETRTKTL